MHPTIYFTTEKSVESKDRLLTLMADTVSKNFDADRKTYLETSINQLTGNDEVKSLVHQLAIAEKFEVKEVNFKPVINVINDNNSWVMDKPRHTHNVKMSITSIDYLCFHVIDEKNFLCYSPGGTKELKKITVNSNMKVFVK